MKPNNDFKVAHCVCKKLRLKPVIEYVPYTVSSIYNDTRYHCKILYNVILMFKNGYIVKFYSL